MAQKKPELSVVVTTYNSASTIKLCLQSIKDSEFINYELIVIDDGSTDDTIRIAKQYTDKVISNKHQGRVKSRKQGFLKAKGKYIVNIDSDVVISPTHLSQVWNYFQKHPNIAAITGRLNKHTPYKNFASIYKALYMHYYFGLLPKSVTFLYGSFFAINSDIFRRLDHESSVSITDDTDLGQALIKKNHQIHILKNILVIHLKYFSIVSLFKNDFSIAKNWSHLFLKNHGWKQLFRKKTGFAHASKEQIVSLCLLIMFLPLFTISIFLSIQATPLEIGIFVSAIFIINKHFLLFLCTQNRHLRFRFLLWILVDYFVMTVGILWGFLTFATSQLVRVALRH